MNPYEILGISKDATASEIKAAYRSLAQQNHPDKGGDTETFQSITKAYEILSDEKRRANYDATGETEDGPSILKEAQGVVAGLFAQLLNVESRCSDFVYQCRTTIADERGRLERICKKEEATLKHLETLVGAVTANGINLFEIALDEKINGIKSRLADVARKLEVLESALQIIGEHNQCEQGFKIAIPPFNRSPVLGWQECT